MVEFRENPVILARMFYAEAKDGTPGKDLPVGKDVDRALMERLQGLTPKFLYIRGAMGVGPEVGFGSLPLTHVSGEGFSIATLPHIKPIGEGNPILHYQILSGIFGSEVKYIAMNPFDAQRILVDPEDRGNDQAILSIYPPYSIETAETQLVDAPDEVFEGAIAHELAHLIDGGVYPIPLVVQDFIERRNRDLQTFINSSDPSDRTRYNEEYDRTNEAVQDVIAGLLGFKKQSLATLQYVIRCVQTKEVYRKAALTEMLQRRAREVEKYS